MPKAEREAQFLALVAEDRTREEHNVTDPSWLICPKVYKIGSDEHHTWFFRLSEGTNILRAAQGTTSNPELNAVHLSKGRAILFSNRDREHLGNGYPPSWTHWASARTVTDMLRILADFSNELEDRCDNTDYPHVLRCSSCSTVALGTTKNLKHNPKRCSGSSNKIIKTRVLLPGEIPPLVLGSDHPVPDLDLLYYADIADCILESDIILTGFASSMSEARTLLESSEELIWWRREDESHPHLAAWKRMQVLDFLLRATHKHNDYDPHTKESYSCDALQISNILEFYVGLSPRESVVWHTRCSAKVNPCDYTAPYWFKHSSVKHTPQHTIAPGKRHALKANKTKIVPFLQLPISFKRLINLRCFFEPSARNSDRMTALLRNKIR